MCVCVCVFGVCVCVVCVCVCVVRVCVVGVGVYGGDGGCGLTQKDQFIKVII